MVTGGRHCEMNAYFNDECPCEDEDDWRIEEMLLVLYCTVLV